MYCGLEAIFPLKSLEKVHIINIFRLFLHTLIKNPYFIFFSYETGSLQLKRLTDE